MYTLLGVQCRMVLKIHSNRSDYEVIYAPFEILRKKLVSPTVIFVVDHNVWDLYSSVRTFVEERPIYVLRVGEDNKTL